MKQSFKSYIKLFFLANILAFCLFASSISFASDYPLKIWVMFNTGGTRTPNLTFNEIQKFLSDLKQNYNIIIENNKNDLLFASGLDETLPLISYIYNKNYVVEELKRFQKNNQSEKQIRIEFIRWADALNRILSAKDSDNLSELPDIIQVGSTWIASLANLDVLEDLDLLFEKDLFFEPSVKSAIPESQKGFYAIPWFADTRVLFYWKDITDTSIFSSWDSLDNNCTDFLTNNPSFKTAIAFPLAPTWNLLHNLTPLLWAYGSDIVEPRYLGSIPFHKVTINNQQSIQAIKTLQRLSIKECALFENITQETLEERFLKKEFASIITGPWFLGRELPKKWQEKIGVILPPKGPEGSFPFVGGSHLGIWHTAKEKGNFASAVEIIKFLSSVESQKRFSKASGLLPVRKTVLEKWDQIPYSEIWHKALLTGKSYPALPSWGTVVENEFTRNNIWHIWQAISQGKSMSVIENILNIGAEELQKKIALNAWQENKKWVLLGFLLFASSITILIIRNRFRYSKTYSSLEKIKIERKALEIKEKQSISRISELKNKLNILGKQRDKTIKPTDTLHITWNGKFLFNNKEIKFENKKQAYKLLEHLIRQLSKGHNTVSCLSGFALFDWDLNKLSSLPNRLFNTGVAKINSELNKNGLPSLLKSLGRNTWKWKCLWKKEDLLSNSDIIKANELAEKARGFFNKSDQKKAENLIKQALSYDPKCINALLLIISFSEKHKIKLEKYTIKSCEKIDKELKGLENEIRMIDELQNNKELSEYSNVFNEELLKIKDYYEHLKSLYNQLDKKNKKEISYHTEIIEKINFLQNEMQQLKTIENKAHVWQTISKSDQFSWIISLPKVQRIINNFYNYETRNKEDPRLVQLAIMLMISQDSSINPLKSSKNEEDFYDLFEKRLKIEFFKLENEISILPAH